MCLEVPDLNDEWVWAIRFALDEQLRHDYSIVRCPSQSTNPPFGSGQVWGVDCEGLIIVVPGGSRLETSDV